MRSLLGAGRWLAAGCFLVGLCAIQSGAELGAMGSPDDLAADFGTRGLYLRESGTWTQSTPWNPEALSRWSDGVAVDFGPFRGLWSLDASSNWSQLTTWDPYATTGWSDSLAAAFDSGRGLYRYQGAAWTQLTNWEPEYMAPFGNDLAVGFGAGRGLWVHGGTGWTSLTPWNPEDLVQHGSSLISDFGPGKGLFSWNGVSWTQLANWDAQHLTVFSEGLAVDFGPGRGIYRHNGSFAQLTNWDPYALVGWTDRLLAAFGDGRGLYVYRSADGWVQLTNWEPIHIEPMTNRVAIDFGAGRGLWLWDPLGGFVKISSWSAETLEATDAVSRGAVSAIDLASEVTDNAYCEDVVEWSVFNRGLELEILGLVNENRAQGADCGSEGVFGPAPPLTMQPALRCAARKHSKDMVERNFFAHDNPDGDSPWDRFGFAGYGGYSWAGENIAAGSSTAAATMNQWMTSDGHCANVMNPNFTELGVGYFSGPATWTWYWTQTFADP